MLTDEKRSRIAEALTDIGDALTQIAYALPAAHKDPVVSAIEILSEVAQGLRSQVAERPCLCDCAGFLAQAEQRATGHAVLGMLGAAWSAFYGLELRRMLAAPQRRMPPPQVAHLKEDTAR